MEAVSLKRVLDMDVCPREKRARLSEDANGSSDSGDTIISPRVKQRKHRRSLDLSSEGNESVYSVQQKETDCAKDTSDTSIDSADSNMTEYEVAQLSPQERNPFFSTDDSDEAHELNEIAELGAVVAAVSYNSVMSDIDIGQLADTSTEASTSPTSNSDPDPELPRMDYLDFWTCAQCNAVNGNRHVPFCSKCYEKRKTFFPPRPRRRKRFAITKLSSDSGVEAGGSQVSEKTSGESSQNISTGGEDVVDGPRSSRKTFEGSNCPLCFEPSRKAVFIHGSTGHVYCCVKCAKTVWKTSGRCPLCRKKIERVVTLLE